MGRYTLAALPGDGIGPEVTAAARRVLGAISERFGHRFEWTEHPVGWAAIQAAGSPLPDATLAACRRADAILLGAVGDPAADELPPERRPEAGLLALRRELDLYANLRPARLPDALVESSPLRPDLARGIDLLIVRELSGGLYYGRPRGPRGTHQVVNTMVYTASQVRRIAHTAFACAAGRRGRLVAVDKANVLEVSRLWREVVREVAADYPRVAVDFMYVDRAAMELVLRPSAVDVWLTSNLFGDILSDEAGAVVGSLGLLGSASLGTGPGLFEPVHGSAPELAGTGRANPLGAIASVALLLRHGLGLPAEAEAVERAVDQVLDTGLRTGDLARPGQTAVGTAAMADAVATAVRRREAPRPGPDAAPRRSERREVAR